jgi:acyl-CoA synthetase (AMP-forming)/AMP-acid ligase II
VLFTIGGTRRPGQSDDEEVAMGFHLAEACRSNAERFGPAPALIIDGGTVTHRELFERSGRSAAALAARGIGRESRVGYLDKNGAEFFDLFVGVARTASVLVPLNWRLTARELGVIVGDAGLELLVVGAAFVDLAAEAVGAAGRDVPTLVIGAGYEEWRDAPNPRVVDAPPDPRDVVLQLYTSGTTGRPKGVLLDHVNLGRTASVAPQWSVDRTSVSLLATPVFHIGGSSWGVVALGQGAASVVVAELRPAELLETMEHHRVTNAFLVPSILQMLCAVPGAAERDWSALRSIAYGASPITTTALRRTIEVFGTDLFQLYGMTETTGAICQLDARDHDPDGPRAHLMRSAGRPYPWVELRVVDSRTGEPMPTGEVGEVRIRGEQVTRGYWQRPEETAATIDADGWLHTGDGGYLDAEGYLFLTDRIKDMIVSGGENVYPVEVEDVLAAHPTVIDVAVIGVPDPKWGETVKAVVVRRGEVGADELAAHCREHLAGYKLPRSFDFVDELPRNASGKVLKRELRAPYWVSAGRTIG